MTAMPTDLHEALDQVKAMLPDTSLMAINFVELQMMRKNTPPTGGGETFPAAIEVGYQVVGATMVYRVGMTVDRPDIFARVVVLVQYNVPDVDAFSDTAVAQVFGERVALPAGYPFARSKLFEMTVDTGVPAVTMGMMDPSRFSLQQSDEAPAPGQT